MNSDKTQLTKKQKEQIRELQKTLPLIDCEEFTNRIKQSNEISVKQKVQLIDAYVQRMNNLCKQVAGDNYILEMTKAVLKGYSQAIITYMVNLTQMMPMIEMPMGTHKRCMNFLHCTSLVELREALVAKMDTKSWITKITSTVFDMLKHMTNTLVKLFSSILPFVKGIGEFLKTVMYGLFSGANQAIGWLYMLCIKVIWFCMQQPWLATMVVQYVRLLQYRMCQLQEEMKQKEKDEKLEKRQRQKIMAQGASHIGSQAPVPYEMARNLNLEILNHAVSMYSTGTWMLDLHQLGGTFREKFTTIVRGIFEMSPATMMQVQMPEHLRWQVAFVQNMWQAVYNREENCALARQSVDRSINTSKMGWFEWLNDEELAPQMPGLLKTNKDKAGQNWEAKYVENEKKLRSQAKKRDEAKKRK
jgi:hypothetical protein